MNRIVLLALSALIVLGCSGCQGVEPEVSATVSPTEPGGSATVSPTEPGVSATVSPTEPEVSATVSPTEPEVSATVSPTEPGVFATVSPTEPEVSATVSPTEPEVSVTVSPTAQEVAASMGLGLNLGNTMEAYYAPDCEKITFEWIPVIGGNTPRDYETCWGAVETTQEVIDGIRAEGFRTVRIPVFWGNMMKNDGTYTIDPDYIARVKEIVDYCQNDGMYTVINIHHFDEFIIRRNSTEECGKIFTRLWTQIAEYFKDYPYTLVFEGYNEYLGGNQFDAGGTLKELSKPEAYKMTNALNQAFVDAVRATGGNNAERVLIVSGYWTNIDNTTSPAFVMPADTVSDRLMVSVHYVDNMMYWTNRIGSRDWLNYTDAQIRLLEKAFLSKNIPVFMGETTAAYPSSNFDRNAVYRDSSECLGIVLDKLTDKGIVPVIWDVNDGFYSRTEYRIKSGSDREIIREISEKIKK